MRALRTAVVFALCLLPLAWLALGVARGDFTDPVRAIQDQTGLWALNFLAITLAVTPLRRLTAWGWLVRWRRPMGLFAFFYATLHVLNYTVFDQALDPGAIAADVAKHPWVLLGMSAFLMLIPLAITSTKGWIRRLGGRRWNRLHRLIYVAAAAGAVHFLLSVKKDVRQPLIYLAGFALLLGARLVWRLGATRARSLSAAD